MSGVLRRGSLNFDCNLNAKSARGSLDSNLYGGFRDVKPRTPEISVIALDFRRNSDDLKKEPLATVSASNKSQPGGEQAHDLSQDIDSDIISNYIGHFGRWQFVWTFVLSLFQIPTTFHIFAFIFQAADKEFWCSTFHTGDNGARAAWRNLTQPQDGCAVLLHANEMPTHCTHFEFSNADGAAKTLIEEYNLVCDRRKLLSVVEMCFLAGAAVGSVCSGWISDRFGRKHTLMGSALIQSVFGTALAFSPSLAMYMSLRVIIGFASMTVSVVSFVLVVELVSGRWRTIIGILNILPVPLSYVFTAGIAYYVRDWRQLQLLISAPWLALLTIWYCVPESPRWLLARGRLDELYAIVERAARMNRLQLPSNYRKSLEATAPAPKAARHPQAHLENATESSEQSATVSRARASPSTAAVDGNVSPLVVVFSKPYCRITCLTLVTWLTLIIIYFGLTLHLNNLGGNIYLNTVIAGAAEAISICASIFVVLKFGIRRNLIAYMLIPGICCLAANFVPNQVWVIALAMIAKCVIGANNAIIPTYTAMQYPTVVRNFGVGMGQLAAGIGLILVPYMWLLEHYEPLLPMSIMGVCGIVGSLALALMKDV